MVARQRFQNDRCAVVDPAANLVQGLADVFLGAGGTAGPMSFAVVGGLAAGLQAIASLPTIAAGAELYKGLRPSGFAPR